MRQLLWVASFLWQLSASSAEGTMLHFENFKVHLKNWLLCYVKHIYTFFPHYFNWLARSLFVVFTKINIYLSICYAFYHLRCRVLKEIDYEQNLKKVPTSKDVGTQLLYSKLLYFVFMVISWLFLLCRWLSFCQHAAEKWCWEYKLVNYTSNSYCYEQKLKK